MFPKLASRCFCLARPGHASDAKRIGTRTKRGGLGLSLGRSTRYCSRPLLPTCVFVWRWCASTLEQCSWRRCLGGLKTGPPRRHQIQPVEAPVLESRAKETYLKRVRKWALEIKSGSPWWVQFWPLHCGKFVEAFISSWSWFDQQQLRLESWTGEAPFCAPAFSYVVRTKKGPLVCHTCTWFVTRKAPCYLAVTWERYRTKILKGLCGVIGWFQVAADIGLPLK